MHVLELFLFEIPIEYVRHNWDNDSFDLVFNNGYYLNFSVIVPIEHERDDSYHIELQSYTPADLSRFTGASVSGFEVNYKANLNDIRNDDNFIDYYDEDSSGVQVNCVTINTSVGDLLFYWTGVRWYNHSVFWELRSRKRPSFSIKDILR